MRILVVEDEFAIAKVVRRALEREGHDVAIADTTAEARLVSDAWGPDLLVLDRGLPDGDGIDVIAAVRERSDVPVIVVSARGEEADRIAGLDGGADDYLVKPFGSDELLARVRAIARRPRREEPPAASVLTYGPLVLDDATRTATLESRALDLRPREYEILRMLVECGGGVVTREAMARSLWGVGPSEARKSIDVHMTWLRGKLGDDPRSPRFIETVRSLGFRLVDQG